MSELSEADLLIRQHVKKFSSEKDIELFVDFINSNFKGKTIQYVHMVVFEAFNELKERLVITYDEGVLGNQTLKINN